MKIQAKLRMLAIVPIVLAVVVACTFLLAGWRIRIAQSQQLAAQRIVNDVFDLNILAYEVRYMKKYMERPKQQWLKKHEQIAADLEKPVKDLDQETLNTAKYHYEQIGNLFQEMIENREEMDRAGDENALLLEREERFFSQILQESELFRETVSKLADSSQEAAQEIQETSNWVVLILVTATVPVLLLISALITGTITRPIARLHEGAGLIGRGDLNHRVATDARDEVGELSRAFDNMAKDLQALIDQHREDEAALRALNEKLDEEVQERTAELAFSNEALQRSNIELQQFAYIASHDLQAPLRSISGFSQLLQKGYKGKLDEKADEWIGFVVDNVAQMQTLIQDLLAFSRVESKERQFEPVALRDAFEDAVKFLDPSIEEAGGEVICDELPTLNADRSQMAQLFQNLIGNGIKYANQQPPRVHLSSEKKDGEWIVSVRDNGIGIDSKHHESVFEIFRRLHTQQEYPGTGIGLAVCRRIVQRHGGRIWVESEPGMGSTFCFTMPEATTES
jgi:signal transduction histidine kinase